MLFPTDLNSFFEFIRQHGTASYSLMFGYAASHTLLLGLFAGYAAHKGALNFTALLAVCWAGTFIGDVIRFWIGRRYGTRWISRFPRLERAIKVVARLADRHYVWMILLHRYPYGIRGVAGFAYGTSQMTWPTFLAINFVAAGIWSVVVLSAGYAFGQVSEKVMNDASSGLSIAMLVGFLGLSWILSKRIERAAEETAAKETATAESAAKESAEDKGAMRAARKRNPAAARNPSSARKSMPARQRK